MISSLISSHHLILSKSKLYAISICLQLMLCEIKYWWMIICEIKLWQNSEMWNTLLAADADVIYVWLRYLQLVIEDIKMIWGPIYSAGGDMWGQILGSNMFSWWQEQCLKSKSFMLVLIFGAADMWDQCFLSPQLQLVLASWSARRPLLKIHFSIQSMISHHRNADPGKTLSG